MKTAASIYVVGGGAAGILAAYRAATLGASVTLLEKKDRLGMKILISGGGHCNVTHAGPMEEVRAAFRQNEARFLKPSFYAYTNRDICEILEEQGISLCTRPDGRIFPREANAKDVVAALHRCLRSAGVEIRLKSPVLAPMTGKNQENGGDPPLRVEGLQLEGEQIAARRVVLTVGGMSYPGTGTTGDGYPWVTAAGHSLVKVRAALAPLFLDNPVPEWAGVAVRNCSLRARQSGKVFAWWKGDLLFTHRGVSGPCALGISREIAERRPAGPVALELDLWPELSPEELRESFRSELQQAARRTVESLLEPVLPARLREAFLLSSGCSPAIACAHLGRTARNAILANLKGWPIGTVQHVPIEKGEVVAGGVALDEVDSKTMRSRKCSGLYLAGEILDIAGPIGGYNLQAAWSTGWVAGATAADDSLSIQRTSRSV